MSTIFDNTNTDGVSGGPPAVTIFGVPKPTYIKRVYLYYFNGGQGADPNTTVTLQGSGGIRFGPFPVVVSNGQMVPVAAPNANVEAFPNVVVPAGRYQIVPTQPQKWSFNAKSGNQGFATVEGDATIGPSTAANQFEPAYWAVGPNQQQRIVWFQPVGIAATYLAIYRITNWDTSTPVSVKTPAGSFSLQPGDSADISAQQIDIVSTGQAAWGTIQDMCCSLAVEQIARPQPPKADGSSTTTDESAGNSLG